MNRGVELPKVYEVNNVIYGLFDDPVERAAQALSLEQYVQFLSGADAKDPQDLARAIRDAQAALRMDLKAVAQCRRMPVPTIQIWSEASLPKPLPPIVATLAEHLYDELLGRACYALVTLKEQERAHA